MTKTETIRRRAALGLTIEGPASTNRLRHTHPMTWLLAAALTIPTIAAAIALLCK